MNESDHKRFSNKTDSTEQDNEIFELMYNEDRFNTFLNT